MPLLEIRNLVKTYQAPEGTPHTVLDLPQFHLDAQAEVALSGESGSGKTTLLHCIAGILAPESGAISLAGHSLTSATEADRDRLRARHVGYIFQTFNLLQGYTCLENVLLAMAFGRGTDAPFAQTLLGRVGLGDKLHHLPRQLSVGQQQRVAVARALANRPQLVLADEPTGNLDAANAGSALALIREMCVENHAALLLVSHDAAVLGAFSDRRDLGTINRAVARPEGGPL